MRGSASAPVQVAPAIALAMARTSSRNDNTVAFGRLKLQIAPSAPRHHFVKAKVQVRRYRDDTIALYRGHRCIGRCRSDGVAFDANQQAA